MRTLTTLFVIVTLAGASTAHAQVRVGRDSSTRLNRFGRDLAYGTAEGLLFAGVDQARNTPASWGGGSGYSKRAASNLGEFFIQEGVTEGVAAIMQRPLDYTRCHCGSTTKRIAWALGGAFTDQMPNGSHPLAVPRILGAYAGSFAQATWVPSDRNKLQLAVLNGTESLAIGGVINLWHEFRHDLH